MKALFLALLALSSAQAFACGEAQVEARKQAEYNFEAGVGSRYEVATAQLGETTALHTCGTESLATFCVKAGAATETIYLITIEEARVGEKTQSDVLYAKLARDAIVAYCK